jgi:tRNA(fMet)-specific endonuclease VapC
LNYLLDTNICIYIKNEQPKLVLDKFETAQSGTVFMSTITYGELLLGAEKSAKRVLAHRLLKQLVDIVPVLPLSDTAGNEYGKLRHHLQATGLPIGANDLWIASHALALGYVLVTNNVSEFQRVPKLKLENWAV